MTLLTTRWMACFGLACALTAAGDDPRFEESSESEAVSDESLESDVRDAVSQLNNPSRAERARAEERIRELGPAAPPFLPGPDEIEQAHVREAVERLRVELELMAAQQSLQPTMVSVPNSATLGEWIESLQTQTGYSLTLADETLASRPLDTIDNSEITFWQAIGYLEDAAAFSADRAADGSIVLNPTAEGASSLHHDPRGAIRVSATPLRVLENLIDPEVNARVRTQIRLDVEPKLAGLFVHWTPADLRITAAGVEFTPVGAAGRRELPIPTSQRVEFPVDFTVPCQPWDEFATNPGAVEMAGSVQMTIATGFSTFEFRHLDESGPILRRRGGLAAALESFESSRDESGSTVWQATLVVDYRSRELELDSYQLWAFSNAVSLLRADGSTLAPSDDRHVSPEQDGAVRMSFRFDDPLEDLAGCTLVYEAPTMITEVPVTFEIALP